MGKLVYSAIASLDGYVVDAGGNFDWAAPDEEVHAAVNEQEQPIGTYLYGRRMYEVMRYWQSADADEPGPAGAYAQIWRAADKIVFSRTLDAVDTPQTRLETSFAPERVAELKAVSPTDLSIGGPTLAVEAFRAGLIDEVSLYLHPVAVGGGTPALPPDLRVDLSLLDERRFSSGVVYLHYAVTGRP